MPNSYTAKQIVDWGNVSRKKSTMPNVKVGVLIKTDVATKIYLQQELEKRDKDIVIQDIDERHLFI